MTSFLMEAVVLCALFHLAIWVQVRQAPARRVYSYAPAFVERYIELGKIPEIKNPSTLERVKKKWPAAIVIGIVLEAIVYFVSGSRLSMPGISFSWLFCRLFSETGNGSEYLAQAKACLKAVSMSIWSSTGTRKWHGRKPCDTGA